MLRKKLENANSKLDEVSGQNNYLESLVLRYEQRVFELEELEVELKEKLLLLEECIKVAEWWAAMVLTSGESKCFKQRFEPATEPLHFN